MSEFQLITDASQISYLQSTRVLVASALLYTYTVDFGLYRQIHYLFMVIAWFFQDDFKMERMYDLGRRLVFYGIAALLSINFLQYGVYHAVMAWVLLICSLIMHSMAFMRDLKENYHNVALSFFYGLLTIWYFGIFFFYFFNAFN